MLFDSLNIPLALFCLLALANNCICQTDPDLGIKFYQWTSGGRIPLGITYSTLRNTSQTHVIVHGWSENSTEYEYEWCAKNYLQMDPTSNVILVDYGVFANVSYLNTSEIVNNTGTIMGRKLIEWIDNKALDIKKIQLFGHSLGSHVCGKAARMVQKKFNERIPRISVSDPAGPFFRLPTGLGVLQPLLPLSESLTKNDADVVDITHASYTTGTLEPFGTVDMYAGILGASQPGCQNITLTGDFLDGLIFCDHRLARAYFIESILSCAFKATKYSLLCILLNIGCEKVVYGQHMLLNLKGIFELKVNASPPYATGVNTYPNCSI